MIFNEIPFELKEHIFTYVTPNEWINTGKVSNEWLQLTLGSIKKVESCHSLILDHLAEFINQQRSTNSTWLYLLRLMPRLVHLECCENTEEFWIAISPICHQLKVLDCRPRKVECFDWNKLNISFKNLVELRWYGGYERPAFLLKIFELAPKLEKIRLKRCKIYAEWKNKIPKSVKHILLKDVHFLDEHQCSMNNLCEDNSALETFAASCESSQAVSDFFDAPLLKKLELSHPNASDILKNVFTKCPNLKTIYIDGDVIRVTDGWRKSIPANLNSFKVSAMSVENYVRPYFSFNWLFQNFDALQSLEVKFADFIGIDPQRFHSPENLKKLYLSHYMPIRGLVQDADPFSDICYHIIGGSHLVDVQLIHPTIGESWRHIFPPTIKRLKLNSFRLSDEAKKVFSPQFICENPSNIEFLSLDYFGGDLHAMDLNAFSGMNQLQELHLINSGVSGECLQSILTHCSVLKNLFIRGLIAGALTNIPDDLVLSSLRKLEVKEPVGQPSLLLQHFPKMRKVDITIVPTKECWLEAMNSLQGVETAEISVKQPCFNQLWSFIESIDHTKFKYLCLSVRADEIFTFSLTNSLLDACLDFHRFDARICVLWRKNYPTSPLLKERMFWIPSSMDELLQRYENIMAP